MANNNITARNDEWRKKIQTSMLVNRLYDNALGKIELTQSQQKSIEILLRKLIPDLKAIDHGALSGHMTFVMQSAIAHAPNEKPAITKVNDE